MGIKWHFLSFFTILLSFFFYFLLFFPFFYFSKRPLLAMCCGTNGPLGPLYTRISSAAIILIFVFFLSLNCQFVFIRLATIQPWNYVVTQRQVSPFVFILLDSIQFFQSTCFFGKTGNSRLSTLAPKLIRRQVLMIHFSVNELWICSSIFHTEVCKTTNSHSSNC